MTTVAWREPPAFTRAAPEPVATTALEIDLDEALRGLPPSDPVVIELPREEVAPPGEGPVEEVTEASWSGATVTFFVSWKFRE